MPYLAKYIKKCFPNLPSKKWFGCLIITQSSTHSIRVFSRKLKDHEKSSSLCRITLLEGRLLP